MKKILLLALFFSYQIASAQQWKDVAPIIYDNCSSCHRPGEIGPFPLMSYHDAINPYELYNIQAYVNQGLMPPWKADPDYRHFLDERVLTQDQKDLISDWVNAGAPAGDTTLAPPPPVFPSGSQLGTPDLVLHMAHSYTTPGDNQDHYMMFVLPTDLLQDQLVSAIEVRPGNGAAVHHTFVYVCDDSSAYNMDATTPEYGYEVFGGVGDGVSANFLQLYGPGMIPRFYPAGGAVKFPEKCFVLIQMHYAPSPLQLTDSSSVNIFFNSDPNARTVYAKRVGEGYITNPPFLIHADMVDTFFSEYPLSTDYSLFAIAPHQHLLGKSYKMWAVTPTQDTLPLISIPQWDFHWQLLYSYPFMLKLPAGTVIHAQAVYDNTVNNPYNPNNPPIDVHYGESSTDEMFKYFINMLDYLPGDEDIVIDSTWNLPTHIVAPVNDIVATPQLYPCSPNPARDAVWVSYFLPATCQASFTVYDVGGKIITTSHRDGQIGFQHFSMDVGAYENGIYFCTMQAGGKVLTKNFVVQH